MTPISIIKIAAPAIALVAAGGAAVVFGLPYVQNGEAPARTPAAALTAPSQTASAPPREAAAAPAAKSESPRGEAKAETTEGGAAKTEVAGLAAQLAGAPAAPSADQSGPSFDLARIEKGGDAVIAGRAAPGATVDLMRNGERLDGAVADASGQFVIVPPRLPAGDYALTLRAKSPDGQVTTSKQSVAVSLKEAEAPIREAAAASTSPRGADMPETTATVSPPRLHPAKPGDAAASQSPHMALASVAADEGAASRDAAASSRVVVRGDSLWRISRLTYGAGQEYALVYRANRNQIRDPNLIHPGQVLILPVKHR